MTAPSEAPFTWARAKVAIGGLTAYAEDLSAFDFRMNCAFELVAFVAWLRRKR